MLKKTFSKQRWESLCVAILSWVAVGGTSATTGDCALAQSNIVPDNTLGSSNSVVTPNVIIKGVPSEEISGGVTRGANLLHSFQEFNINSGRGAYFTNPAGIENILTRVTGGNPSRILGKLGVIGGNANLFFMNPNGIIFGETASLDVMGSFVGTTASAIRLTNGDIFSANGSQLPTQVLNVNPNAFFANQIAEASTIAVNQSFLSVREGMSLLLLGGNVSLDGSALQALGGRVELGGLVSGTVELEINGHNLNLRSPQNIQRGDVFLMNKAQVDVTDKGQGSVAINAINLEMSGESSISAGIKSGANAVNLSSQDVTLNATGVVTISQNSQIKNQVERNATGNAGNININAGRVEVTGGQIRTRTLGEGNAGNINIKAGEILVDNPPYTIRDSDYRVAFEEKAALDASNDGTFVSGKGRSGNISLEASGLITLIGRGDDVENKVISTYTNATGRGGSGNVSLKAGSISLNNAYIVSSSFNGDAGEILLQGNESIFLTKNSSLVATNFAKEGNSGNVTLKSSGSVLVENSLISSNIGAAQRFSFPEGNAGNISISGKSVFVTAGSEVTARSPFGGNSGNIQVDAVDMVEISGRIPELFTENNRSGTAFYSTLVTTAEAESKGQAGNININIPDGILRVADGANLRAESQGEFKGGNIIVNAKVVELTAGGKLFTSASSKGDAGNITLNASDRIVIKGRVPDLDELFNAAVEKRDVTAAERIIKDIDIPSGIYANTSNTSTAKSGDIKITTGQLIVRDDAQISVSSGQKNAGNLEIQARSILLNNKGEIRAATASGEGGNIKLQVKDFILMRRQSQISAKAENNGNGGNVNINIPNGIIVAVANEDNNIIANAQAGNGGKITIVSSGIYGFKNNSSLTTLSDINASSDFGSDGTVQIVEILRIDPDLRFNLPTEIVRVEFKQSCGEIANQAQNRFVITGRGGIPSNPYEPLKDESAFADWIALDPKIQASTPTATIDFPHSTILDPIIEATGWAIDSKGEVSLTASSSLNPPSNSKVEATGCEIYGNPK